MSSPSEHSRNFLGSFVPMPSDPKFFHIVEGYYKDHSVEELQSILTRYQKVLVDQSIVIEEKDKIGEQYRDKLVGNTTNLGIYVVSRIHRDTAIQLHKDAEGMIALMNCLIKRKTN